MSADPVAVETQNEKLTREAAELAQKWLKEIKRLRDKEEKWRERARKTIDRYRDERGVDDTVSKYNILWANTEVQKPAIFSRMPVVDVRRRYNTNDPAARTAALILERALSYNLSTYDFRDVLNRVNEDFCLPGRTTALVCYEPLMLNKAVKKPVQPLPASDMDEDEDDSVELDGQRYPAGTQLDGGQPYQMGEEEYKVWESVYCDYVPWNLFGFSECVSWAKCPAAWIGEYMTKDDVRTAFPDFGDLDILPFQKTDDETDKEKRPPATVLIWKVWHRPTRTYMCFCEGYTSGPLKIVKDPLQLEKFFQMAEPMYTVRNNGTWIPVPEYYEYQDQAIELDEITNRLKNLVNACKNRGVYDSAIDMGTEGKLADLTRKPDNTFLPVPNYQQLAEKGGLEALLSTLPLENIITAIAQLRERSVELKQEIYEIIGVSDIMRGASEASETLGAQQLKAQYGGLRISTKQERFQEFIRELVRISAEIICEHFDADTLRLMSGIQVLPDPEWQQLKMQQALPAGAVSVTEFQGAIQILKDDKLRGFKVDIETDSTIPVDKQTDQQNRIAFITAVGTYLQGVIPAVQSGAVPIKVAREGLLFVVRGFKVGTELEEVLEQLGEDQDAAQQLALLKQQLAQMQETLKQLQQENLQLKQDHSADQARAAADTQVSTAKASNDIATDNAVTANKMRLASVQAAQPKAVA